MAGAGAGGMGGGYGGPGGGPGGPEHREEVLAALEWVAVWAVVWDLARVCNGRFSRPEFSGVSGSPGEKVSYFADLFCFNSVHSLVV